MKSDEKKKQVKNKVRKTLYLDKELVAKIEKRGKKIDRKFNWVAVDILKANA